ncbi:hypothetical protein ACFS27_04255 [Promicromonospora vindobonensis]|uniref:CARDB domain-containing protein n=1 Tax=Promicromonospora vindobonensis TaxID=195748 RepID=A0ABW5VP86_9MICO
MSWDAGWVSVVIAVVFGVAALAMTRRYGARRGRLAIEWAVNPLVSSTTVDLDVSFQGTIVSDPHVLTVAIRNIGAIDISSKAFDAEQPLALGIDGLEGSTVRIVAVGSDNAHAAMVGAQPTVLLPPQLIKRGNRLTITVVTDGRVSSLTYSDVLENVDVEIAGATSRGTADRARTDRLRARPEFWAAVAIIALGAWINIHRSFVPDVGLYYWNVPFALSGMTIVGLLVVAIIYVVRAVTRRLRR